MGWQWAASVGADAAAFVRVFNPVAQAEKVDPDGAYRQQWLGDGPRAAPIVEHRAARKRALAAYAAGKPMTKTLPAGSPASTSSVDP